MKFGEIVRGLRKDRGEGLKRVAPAIGVSYTYLSKIENNRVSPSDELVGRMAQYFGEDRSALLLAAGRVPPDVLEILRNNPNEAVRFLKERFGARDD